MALEKLIRLNQFNPRYLCSIKAEGFLIVRFYQIFIFNLMGTKEKIIAKISSIDDENYLKHLLNVLNAVEETEEVYNLSEPEKRAVKEGLKDVAEGRVHPQSEVDERTKKWLKGNPLKSEQSVLSALHSKPQAS